MPDMFWTIGYLVQRMGVHRVKLQKTSPHSALDSLNCFVAMDHEPRHPGPHHIHIEVDIEAS